MLNTKVSNKQVDWVFEWVLGHPAREADKRVVEMVGGRVHDLIEYLDDHWLKGGVPKKQLNEHVFAALKEFAFRERVVAILKDLLDDSRNHPVLVDEDAEVIKEHIAKLEGVSVGQRGSSHHVRSPGTGLAALWGCPATPEGG